MTDTTRRRLFAAAVGAAAGAAAPAAATSPPDPYVLPFTAVLSLKSHVNGLEYLLYVRWPAT